MQLQFLAQDQHRVAVDVDVDVDVDVCSKPSVIEFQLIFFSLGQPFRFSAPTNNLMFRRIYGKVLTNTLHLLNVCP